VIQCTVNKETVFYGKVKTVNCSIHTVYRWQSRCWDRQVRANMQLHGPVQTDSSSRRTCCYFPPPNETDPEHTNV